MHSRRIFAWVWRINGLIILGAGFLAIVSLCLALGFAVRDRLAPRQGENRAKVQPEQTSKAELKLANFTSVRGTAVLSAALDAEQDYRLNLSSKEGSSTRNYLFYDTRSHDFYWLKSGNDALIIDSQVLPTQDYNTTASKPLAVVVYTLITQDTNQDGRLTLHDRHDIALADPDGRRFQVVLSQVDGLKGLSLLSPQKAVMLYMAQSQLQAAEIDLGTQKVLQRYPFSGALPTTP